MFRFLPFALLICLTALAPAYGENWPQWRGPTSNGVAPAGSYPTEWSGEEHVAWKRKLPVSGSSTPAVWGELIFLTSAQGDENTLLCLNRDGQPQWETKLGAMRKGKHRKATSCNSSPVTDGQHVYAYFKSGDLACLDFDGKVIWQTNLQREFGEDTLWWDLGTSPVLTQRHVVIAVVQTGPSYIVAFDKQTGKLAWKRDRNLGAPVEAAQTYATPIVVEQDGKETLVVLGADHVTAHDAQDGSELWRVGGMNPKQDQYFRSISSPVSGTDIVVAPYARGSTVTAIKMAGQGDVTQSHVAWKKEDLGADVPTPIVMGNKLYICGDNGNRRGRLTCLELGTGEKLWELNLPRSRSSYSSSPILAGGKLYVTREDGVTFVVDPGETPQVVAENRLADEFTAATPVFTNGQILIRTFGHLYCIR
ncbi:MAG TPA: hypothetical protein DCY79_21445 [Planctomycetaceae bacterium]|nr:hypothetical protein [Planctomycetaceae bacterium]